MVLDGRLSLRHQHQHEVQLMPFQTDTFSGDWKTESSGIATDFNLMLREGCKGSVKYQTIGKNDFQDVAISMNRYIGVFVYTGTLQINYLYDKLELNQGDFVLLTADQAYEEKAVLSSDTEAVIIKSAVTTD